MLQEQPNDCASRLHDYVNHQFDERLSLLAATSSSDTYHAFTEFDEKTWAACLKAYHIASWDLLLRSHTCDVMNWARILLRVRGMEQCDALSITWQTFDAAIDSIVRFEWTGHGSVTRWLYGITRNKVRRLWHEESSTEDISRLEDWMLDSGPGSDAESCYRHRELCQVIEYVLDNHNKTHREIFQNKLIGYSYAELAEKYYLSPSAISKVIQRIRTDIRHLVEH
jgi:DNA-directed RNA polymerase specialized sigma24 family protein